MEMECGKIRLKGKIKIDIIKRKAGKKKGH